MNRVRVTPHFLHRGAPRRRKIGGSFAGKFPQYCVKMLLTKPRWIGRTPRGGDVPISCNANSSKVLYPEFSSWKTQRAIAFICKGERERERERERNRADGQETPQNMQKSPTALAGTAHGGETLRTPFFLHFSAEC